MGGQVVYLWDSEVHGLPATAEQALSVLEGIRKSQQATHSKNLRLLAQDIQNFVRASGVDELMEDYGDFAITFNEVARFMAIDVDRDGGTDLLRFLVKVAPKHHVIVLSAEPLTLFLPNGMLLPLDMRSVWEEIYEDIEEAASPFPRTKGAFKREFDRRFLEMLSKHRTFDKGFTPKKGIVGGDSCFFSDLFDGCRLYISSLVSGDEGEFSVNVYVSVSLDCVQDIMNDFKFILPQLVFEIGLFSDIFGGHDKNKVGYLSSIGMIDDCICTAVNAIFPIFEKVSSIKDLDGIINNDRNIFSECIHDYIYMPQCLVLARLADNKDFDNLSLKLFHAKKWYANSKFKDKEWPRLVKYLREEVKPLV